MEDLHQAVSAPRPPLKRLTPSNETLHHEIILLHSSQDQACFLLQYDVGHCLGSEDESLVPVWHRKHEYFSLKEGTLEESVCCIAVGWFSV